MEVILQTALKEIRKTVRCATKANGFKPNTETTIIFRRCESYFSEIITCLEKKETPCSEEEQNAFLQALDDGGYRQPPRFVGGLMHTTAYKKWRSLVQPFNTEHMTNAFGDTPNHSIELLPYLMAAYYLNSIPQQKIASADVDILFIQKNNADENYSRALNQYLSRFSLENNISNFLKKKHSEYPKEVSDIKSREDLENFLSRKEYRRDHKKTMALLYENIYRAFLYSICVLSCMQSEHIADKVNYVGSFELFNAHTMAFSTSYKMDIDPDTEQYVYQTIGEFLSDPESYKKIKSKINALDKEQREALERVGIKSAAMRCRSKLNESARAKHDALLTAANFHPYLYHQWWPIVVRDGCDVI